MSTEKTEITRSDYCGPFWMPSFLRKWASSKFNASCKIHDMDYGSPKYTQKDADSRFLYHMMKQASGSMFWIIVAFCFYLMVRAGGWISYKKTKDLRESKKTDK